MAIPKFEKFLYPFLLQLKDKEVSTKEMKTALILHFNLTEEDCQLKTRSGSTLQLNDRIGWSRQWLRRALFIEIPQRGVYRITQRGRDYLNAHTDLRESDLLQYPEFREYANATIAATSAVTSDNGAVEDIKELTPTEQMDNAFKSINEDLAADLLQKVLEMSPEFFEKLVLDLLLSIGFGSRNKDMAIVSLEECTRSPVMTMFRDFPEASV